MLPLTYYGLFNDVEVISRSGHVLLGGVFAMCVICMHSNNISLGVVLPYSFENC